MSSAFPGAKNMDQAVSQMQGMLKGVKGQGRGPQMNAQMKRAMQMLEQLQRGGKP